MFIGDKIFFIENILKTDSLTLDGVLREPEKNYKAFTITKSGKERAIQAIDGDSALYMLQKNLCKNFLEKIPLPIPAVGFVKKESYMSFLSPHIQKRYYLRLDIKDFFGSITHDMVTEHFREFFSDEDCLGIFADLCTYNGRLPQGGVTSPAISNIVFRRADQRVLKYCQSFDVIYNEGRRLTEDIGYTRYADDMLFSGNHVDFSKSGYFAGMIGAILKDFGFELNKSKVKHGKEQISLSGYVVSENIHLSRKKLYSLNKLLHFFGKTDAYTDKKYRVRKAVFSEPDWLEQVNGLALADGSGGVKKFATPQELLDYLCGYRAFLISVLKGNEKTDSGMRQLDNKVRKLESVINAVLSAC